MSAGNAGGRPLVRSLDRAVRRSEDFGFDGGGRGRLAWQTGHSSRKVEMNKRRRKRMTGNKSRKETSASKIQIGPEALFVQSTVSQGVRPTLSKSLDPLDRC